MFLILCLQVGKSIQKAQIYKDLDTELCEWLDGAQRRVDEITSQPIGLSNADSIKVITDDLSHLDAEIETNKTTLQRLKGIFFLFLVCILPHHIIKNRNSKGNALISLW